MARRKLKRKKAMYQTEGLLSMPKDLPSISELNRGVGNMIEPGTPGTAAQLAGLELQKGVTGATRGVAEIPPGVTRPDTILTTPMPGGFNPDVLQPPLQTPPFAQPSLYETYTKAGINIPEGYMDATDDEIKKRFGKVYDLKTQLMRGGFLEPGVEEV